MECLIIFKVIFFKFFLKQKIEWDCFNSLDSAWSLCFRQQREGHHGKVFGQVGDIVEETETG